MNNTDNTKELNTVYTPCIDPVNNTCVTDKGITIHDCIILDNGNIKGFTPDNVKALYKKSINQWLIGGKKIRESNLINLKDRTKDERLKIIEKANESKRQNIEQKKNFNELAKALLEQVASDKVINETLEDPGMMIDNTYGSLILAAMLQGAKNGSFKCAEFIRDTAGYKPKNEVELQADIMTEADKSLIDKALKTG